ncbi:Putative glycoside hydrolase family 16, concanavalin A-like lectin/glucanase domain superfamily [Septoria linicola]|uniref:Glycoside hydrolase family 16, concanavalin A-like lectin/glucanase domain superfamily n=1 Tax=Septoria linicola TaxID=215465 RepID=A0A9Q9AIE5_9PEZI|nr:putative glycoside hydrolase family 16, concanavalin A-like lectin/glucanase domain superfamily [Septoria linicola]USW49837.1 Putative glycoside hydrolase family 16, concanavalin A-like lectin/glucanase domain superfamily [Septoria linicola]
MRVFTLSAASALLATSAQCEATSNCACGYTTSEGVFYTEALETDFLHVQDLTRDTSAAWIPQSYNVTPEDANGPYGKASQVENVVTNPVRSGQFDWTGPGVHDGDPGLQLWARSKLVAEGNGELIPMAEVVSARDDMLYGSFRIGMKTTRVSGTCGAFFYYFNDSNEIDMEFLSKQNEARTINLVLQSPHSADVGYASGPDFSTRNLSFAPEDAYNEYRFDWLPGRVDFYANSQLLSSVTQNVPNQAGKVHISHWSNGNGGWSAGPPKEDAVLTVSYVKAYFNSSDARTGTASLKDCTAPQQLCHVLDQTAPPDPSGVNGNETGRTPFLTPQGANETLDGEAKESGGGRSKSLPDAWWTAFIFTTVTLALLLDSIA